MKVKINKFLCPKGFIITLFGTIYVRDYSLFKRVTEPYSYVYNHECIHEQLAHNNWMLFYLKYIWYYIIHLHWLFIDKSAPYRFHPMEIEAYMNQYNLNYIFSNDAGYNWEYYKHISKSIVKDFYKKYQLRYYYDYIHEKL